MNIKRLVLAGGSMATAAAIGFVMQSGDTAQGRYASAAAVPDISGTAAEPLQVTDIKLTSASSSDVSADLKPMDQVKTTRREDRQRFDSAAATGTSQPFAEPREDGVQTAALGDTALSDTVPESGTAPLPSAGACAIEMTAQASAAAMVDVTLTAACFPNDRVTIHHNGMMFTQTTDENGVLKAMVPALSQNAVFIAAFSNGEGALANAEVTSLEFYDRMVVQSKASSELHINAFEFGAEYLDPGHVTAKSARSMEDAAKGEGGFITTLGDFDAPDALVAEIYTFPTATSKHNGDVNVSVDAEVTTANCGLRVEAQTLEVSAAGTMKVQDLTLPIPACDAVGDFLVLQNLLGDLKVARN